MNLDKNAIKTALSVSVLLGHYGFDAPEEGRTVCPLCGVAGDKDTAQISTEHFYCHRCNASLDIYDIVQEWNACDFKESVFFCAELIGLADNASPEQKAELEKRKTQAAAKREGVAKERERLHAEAATIARDLWESAPPANEKHGYLHKKQVPNLGLRLDRTCLLLPAYDGNGNIMTLQRIDETGFKSFLPSGKTKGGFYAIPAKDKSTNGTLYICEGYSTGASVHMATDASVLVAFNAANLLPVAMTARAKYPQRGIVIAADNDIYPAYDRKKNVGVIAAEIAAQDAKALLAIPKLAQGGKCDFNDLHAAEGLEVVKIQLEAAIPPPPKISQEVEVQPQPIMPDAPLPLRAKPQEQKPYPIEALGEFAEVVQVVADHVAAPLPMVAASLLAVLSLCTQRLANVVHEGRTVLLSLYFLTIAGSGERKSTIDDIMTAAIREYGEGQFKAYQEALRLWKIELRAHEVAKKNIEKGKDLALIRQGLLDLGAEPEKPISPRLLLSNVNVEGLYRLYFEGVIFLGLFSDEAGTVFGGTSFANENKLKTIAFFASLWSSGRADKVRMVEGDSHIIGKRLASHLMLQPVIAEALLADELLQQQGFFPRFLMTASKSLKGTRLKGDTPQGDIRQNQAVQAFSHVCHKLLIQDTQIDAQGATQYRELTLSPEAEQIYRKLYNATEKEQAEHGELVHVSNYASRCAEQAQRIAGVLTLAQNPTAKTINGTTMSQATQLALWYLAEAKRLTEDSGVSAEIVRAEKLLKWLETNGEKFVTTQKMAQYTRLKDTKEVKDALKLLHEHGYVKTTPKGTLIDGKPSNTAWEVAI